MNNQQRIAARLVEICNQNGLFSAPIEDLNVNAIGDLDLRENAWFDSMSLKFLQVEIESEWGVSIPDGLFAAWLRTLNQIAGYLAEREGIDRGAPAFATVQAQSGDLSGFRSLV